MSEGRVMTDPREVTEFVLAGHATLTLKSKVTGSHYTFRVVKPKKGDRDIRFVTLLTAPETYTYVGMVTEDKRFTITRASKFTDESVPVKAFRFFWGNLINRKTINETLEVRHNGHCGRCGRELTVPESIDRGIGPECWEKMFGSIDAFKNAA